MNIWPLLRFLFGCGLFLLGIGIWIFANPKLRTQKDQRKAGRIFIIVGLVLISPFVFAVVDIHIAWGLWGW